MTHERRAKLIRELIGRPMSDLEARLCNDPDCQAMADARDADDAPELGRCIAALRERYGQEGLETAWRMTGAKR